MAIPFLSIFSAIVINKIFEKKLGLVFGVSIIFLGVLSGFIDLAGSNLNRNFAYSGSDLRAGEWIMSNTPQKSVFITTTSIHSPVTDIAGRLRVLSYTTWPYTHGFNIGEDNIFTRQEDVKNFFVDQNNEILDKYGVSYVYFGPTERSDFPEAKNKLESNTSLQKVYEENDVEIFKKIK
jgi:uncharacterized membrane protein